MLRRATVLFACLALWLSSRCAAADSALFFLFDTSGSLRAEDLELAKALVREFLAERAGASEIGVMAFDDRPRVVAPLGATSGEADAGLGQVHIGGRHTALHDALWDAAKLLGESGAARRGIVLLSDGRDENSALLFTDAERGVVENRVMVFAIGVGRVDERFMRRFVKLTDGVYFPAETLADPGAIRAQVEAGLLTIPLVAATPSATAVPLTPPAADPVLEPDAAPTMIAATTPPSLPPAGTEVPWLPALLAGFALLLTTAVIGLLRRRPAPAPRRVVRTPVASSTVVAATPQAKVAPASIPRIAEPIARAEEAPLDPLAETVNLRASDVLAAVAKATNAGVDRTLILGSRGRDDSDGLVGESMDRTFLLAEQSLLVVTKGRNLGERYLLDLHGDTFVGRAKVNEIVLEDRSVSTRHLRLRSEGMVVTALDLGSSNGSFLNERRMNDERQLQAGDMLRVGETELEFRVEQRAT